MMYANEAKATADNAIARKEIEERDIVRSYITSVIMPAISFRALKGHYDVEFESLLHIDKDTLLNELEAFGYRIETENNYVIISWG